MASSPRTAFVLSGGVSHGFDQGCFALVALLDRLGMAATVVAEPSVLASLDHDLFVVDALWWTMRDERYAEVRAEWARSLGADEQLAIERHVRSGRPILAIHTAVICFDDWPRWAELLGCRWNWERSSHPPFRGESVRVSVHPGSDGHPIVAGTRDFDVVDEVYGFLDLADDIEPLLTSPHGGADHPLLWARTVSDGSRVVVDLLGHDARSMTNTTHGEILTRSIDWLMEVS